MFRVKMNLRCKNEVKANKENRLDKLVEGYKVRLQFFSGLLGLLLALYLYLAWVFGWFVLWGIWSFEDILRELDQVIVRVFLVFIGPLFVLSVINRFIGPVICILADDGIHHKGGFVKWTDILSIEYRPDIVSKIQFSRIVIHTRNDEFIITHAPLYMLIRIKRIQPQIKIRLNKFEKYSFIILMVVFMVMGAVLPVVI